MNKITVEQVKDLYKLAIKNPQQTFMIADLTISGEFLMDAIAAFGIRRVVDCINVPGQELLDFEKEQMNKQTNMELQQEIPISQTIRNRIKASGKRFFANDNIAEFMDEHEKQALIEEATTKFEAVLDTLLIDRENDPNSHDTGRRLSKMFINELFEGRYTPEPKVTAFPNEDIETRYDGMLITKAEIKSSCSHHWQAVTGTAWIAILPSTKVIGLSKYARLAQWLARRGTLQEELTKQIADSIMKHTGSKDVAVVIQASHGCCSNRGIMANDSSTWTSSLSGQFFNPSVKSEFYSLIQGNMGGFRCN